MKWQGPTGPVYRREEREAGGVGEYEREKAESQEPRAAKGLHSGKRPLL